MFNDTVVVQSAISAFNNAALWNPAFFWWTILALPLFVMVYWFGGAFMQRVGWTRQNLTENVSVWTAGLTLCWVVLMGGNWTVLRDSLSVLPMMLAAIVFLTSLCVSAYLRGRPLPCMNWRRWLIVIFVIVMVGLSDVHTWWGPLLQVGALCLGAGLGRVAKAEMRPVSGSILIAMMVVIAILMQPEFFRFGQLGNLTLVHLGAILIMGMAAVATIAIQNVSACAKIKNSIYVKVKWLMRVVCVLGAALFLLTEAVPVFIGTMCAMFVAFAMTVWHADNFNVLFANKTFSLMLVLFGAITVMPVIVAMGILYWVNTPKVNFVREIKALL